MRQNERNGIIPSQVLHRVTETMHYSQGAFFSASEDHGAIDRLLYKACKCSKNQNEIKNCQQSNWLGNSSVLVHELSHDSNSSA